MYIGPHIKVTISQVSGQQVRLGIDAPDDLVILREELVETVQYPNAPSD